MTVYKTKTCAYCPLVTKYLDRLGVKYTVVDCSDDVSLLEPAVKISGAYTVPQLVVGDQAVVGPNYAKIKELVKR